MHSREGLDKKNSSSRHIRGLPASTSDALQRVPFSTLCARYCERIRPHRRTVDEMAYIHRPPELNEYRSCRHPPRDCELIRYQRIECVFLEIAVGFPFQLLGVQIRP